MDRKQINNSLNNIYRRLFERYGSRHWWPAEEPFEVMVGAILTQSTAWVNVEKAISNLKAINALSPQELRRLSLPELATCIRPSGYYNAKAKKLKALVNWLGEQYDDNLSKLFGNDIEQLRQQLLSVYGIGEETADSIILYAANKPIFVIDAYTRRVFDRLGIKPAEKSYEGYQSLFMANLPQDTALFNEYHALIVHLGKYICRKKPLCQQCCLSDACQSASII